MEDERIRDGCADEAAVSAEWFFLKNKIWPPIQINQGGLATVIESRGAWQREDISAQKLVYPLYTQARDNNNYAQSKIYSS